MSNVKIGGLLKHQKAFIDNTSNRFVGLVGGYGSGKTRAFLYKAIQMASLNIGFTGLLCEPTNTMLYDVLIPEFESLLEEVGIPYDYKQTPRPEFTLYFKGGKSVIKLRSAENFSRLHGMNIGWFGVDEIDTAFNRNKDKILRMWRAIIARMRAKAPTSQGFVCSTPEGFGFLHQFFVKDVEEAAQKGQTLDRFMIKAKTSDNRHLDPEYIADLRSQYPPNLLKAYLEGEFVNLNTATVYDSFCRTANAFTLNLEEFEELMGTSLYMPDSIPSTMNVDEVRRIHRNAQSLASARRTPLLIGMDFNVNKCAAVVHVVDAIGPIAIDEINDMKNTEAMIVEIKRRYPGRHITIFPDSSGKSEKSNSSATDINLLKQAGFELSYNNKNPFVVDRVNSMNAMFLNGNGDRRYRVNITKCARYVAALEQQTYDTNGKPDKSHDVDHPNDAAGYFIWKRFPLVAYTTRKAITIGG